MRGLSCDVNRRRLPVSHVKRCAVALLGALFAWGVPLRTLVPTRAAEGPARPPLDGSATGDEAASSLELGEFANRSPEEIVAAIRRWTQQEPSEEGEQQHLAHMRKTAINVVAASDRALALAPRAETAAEAHFFRLQALDLLRQLGEQSAEGRLDRAIAAARAANIPQVVRVGMKFYIESGMNRWSTFSDEAKATWAEEIGGYVRDVGVDKNQAETLMVVADFLGNEQEFEIGKALLEKLLPLFRDHPNPEVQGATPMLEGVARRLDLPGKELKLSGTLLNGNKIDWNRYQGKIVLVDFYASWCGPCHEELPNVMQMYRVYHDSGFEVVGVCLDEDDAAAQTFVENKQLPWESLFSDDPARRGWDDPLAVHLGVTGIPFTILLDRSGKVVSTNARGPELERLLRRLLGDRAASAALRNRSANANPSVGELPAETPLPDAAPLADGAP